ncbi:HAD-like domain-containing protein [Elsinoe ampelina]|uniref:HAD-like domain-containing protein n=1 Tax=Elsinoe ampelina TaxID=302913 RepID=A0A6A6FZF9_9PEZI|nr:HAD-like domain-containing protein [Elsinoe ampelina]
MAASTLPAMKTSPKFIFFTDFDGTITLRDSNDFLTDNIGFGYDKRRQGNQDVLTGKETFRQSFRKMMDSVTTPYNECIDLLVKNIKLDPGFNDFFRYALDNNIPVFVLSSGMTPIIRAILANLVGPDADKIDVVCNEVGVREGKKSINEEGGWELVWHDDSDFGHDKSLTIRPYRNLPEKERPTLFYAGDGVSDLSAAKETDLLFAKKGHDLIDYCVKEDVPFTVFEDWSSIHKTVKDIV